MSTRRNVLRAMAASPLLLASPGSFAQDIEPVADSYELVFPDFDSLEVYQLLGDKAPNALERQKAADMIKAAPMGPTPFAIAQHFIDRYATQDPNAISQWPRPAAWNPLIVEFFSATALKVNNDMIAWCAAFANWCIERAQKDGSNSAASQSFLNKTKFKQVSDPAIGDLAIFTCYDKVSNRSLGLGHVAFVKELPAAGKVRVIGGNQSADGHSSIISDKYYQTSDRAVTRSVNGGRVACNMRLNTYISMA